MKKHSIPYGRQNITQADLDAVNTALQHDFLTQGPQIDQFEREFAEYIGSTYAVAVSNGTAALHLSALALGCTEGQKVLCTPITFSASANCVLYCGGEVEFVDVNPDTALMDINLLRQKLESAPKGTYSGVIPVDFGGQAVNLEEVKKLAEEFELWVLEDSCHAPGGSFTDSKGTKQMCGNGSYADAAIFSFHPVKHIACGEGGMITTNSEKVYNNLLKLRTHGITKNPDLLSENHGGWYHEMQTLGYNYRITGFQSALGSSQLKRADEGLERRRAIARKYNTAFQDTVVNPLAQGRNDENAYHLYVVRLNNRKEVYDKIREHGIYSQVHYIPVHLMPYYQSLGFKKGDFPNAENYYAQCLSLPMYPTLTDEEQDFVIEQVLNYAK